MTLDYRDCWGCGKIKVTCFIVTCETPLYCQLMAWLNMNQCYFSFEIHFSFRFRKCIPIVSVFVFINITEITLE